MALKKVTIYNSVGKQEQDIEVSGSTFGDLMEIMDSKNITYRGMTAIDGGSQNAFTGRESVLPESDFILFLLPKEVKSGLVENDFDGDMSEEESGMSYDDDDDDDTSDDDDDDDDDDLEDDDDSDDSALVAKVKQARNVVKDAFNDLTRIIKDIKKEEKANTPRAKDLAAQAKKIADNLRKSFD